MSLIRITPFSGLMPKSGKRLLPKTNAVVANNLKLQSGEIRPLNGISVINKPTKVLPAQAIYLARNNLNSSAWFSWPFDVDVVRAPLSIDIESRFYWTGEGAPKFSTFSNATSSGLNNYPSNYFDLGIPVPQTKPTVSSSGGVGAPVSRFYVYTYFSQYGEESAPSPVSSFITGKVDDVWAISNMDEFPTNTGTIAGTFASNVTTFNNTTRHWLRVNDTIILGGTEVLVASIPSATTFTVAGNYAAITTWSRKGFWNVTNMKRRLYRTTGTTGKFQLVADNIPATYNDTLTDLLILGDQLISAGWIPPPVGLKSIAVHPSGALVGLSGNQLCFSEPYQPHAWPARYQLSTDYEGVGIGVFGTEIGIGTKGNPYIVSGVDPTSMSVEKIDGMYPCLSKRSIISISDGFMYATNHGYISIGSSGVNMFSDQFYTKDEWRTLNPSSMIATPAYGRIYIGYSTSTSTNSMIIMEQGLLISSDINITELYTDVATGEIYVSTADGISEWDSVNAVQLNSRWRSKDYLQPAPINMGAAKIDFDLAIDPVQNAIFSAMRDAIIASNAAILATGRSGGELNSAGFSEKTMDASNFKTLPEIPLSNFVTFILRNGESIIVSRTVSSTKAFRLPAGYKADVFSVEVLSQCVIKEIRIAQTMDGLREA